MLRTCKNSDCTSRNFNGVINHSDLHCVYCGQHQSNLIKKPWQLMIGIVGFIGVIILIASGQKSPESGSPRPIFGLSAASINLGTSDIGTDFGLMSEQGIESFLDAKDANVRTFINNNRTEYLTSNIIVFDLPVTDSLIDLFSAFETKTQNLQPNINFVFGELISQSIGDRAGYKEYSMQNGTWKGATLIFVKSNIIVIIDYLSSTGDSSKNNLVNYANKILVSMDSPRELQNIPTITPLSLPTLSSHGDSYLMEGLEFSTYLSSNGGFRIDLPSNGCSQNEVIITCDISSNKVGFLNVVSGPSNGALIDDSNSREVALLMIDAIKPTGMLTSYSNLQYIGKRNEMFAYCYEFIHQNLGNGYGCLGFETINANLYVIQFFTFNLSRDQIIWDTAFSTFEVEN